ncbi:MAG: pilus assembly PilX N-terminal domain-containing protein [Lachnospiraceae bacterium]|nr:pilus assembly PilX N-terminal domain-containing protein [Lachnospiraceae bacterium]
MLNFLRNKRGSSLAMVLIAMSFMAILGVTVITLTITNMRMKYAQAGGQKEFYDVEGAMETVVAGLENDSEKCASYAYSDALANYSSIKTGASANNLETAYNNNFFRYMVYELLGFDTEKIYSGVSYSEEEQKVDTKAQICYNGGINGHKYGTKIGGSGSFRDQYGYKISEVDTPINDFLNGVTDTYNELYYSDKVIANYLGKAMIKGTQMLNTKGEALTGYYVPATALYPSNSNKWDNVMEFEYDDNGYPTIILRNIRLRSPKNEEYYASITTDIKITVPPTDAETFTQYLDYAIIADDQIKVPGVYSISVDGNAYAGTVNRTFADDSDADNGSDGIIVNGGTLSISAEDLITRGDILVRNRGTFQVNALDLSGTMKNSVWAENIRTEKVGGVGSNVIDIHADTYVADDFELNAPNDRGVLQGQYFGYSYNDINQSETLTTDDGADFSSTITLNGGSGTTPSYLSISNLQKLVLAGSTYISKPSASDLAAGETEDSNTRDIKMYEGLTSKASQLVYYVPADYISTDVDAPASWSAPKKCILSDGSQFWFDHKGYSDDYLGGTSVENYIDLTANDCIYRYFRNKTGVSGSNGTVASVMYYYLRVTDTNKAGEFYNKFMENAPTASQIKTVDWTIGRISDKYADAIITSAGNILYNTTSSGNLIKLGNSDPSDADSSLVSYGKSLNTDYLSLQMSLLQEYSVATTLTTQSTPQYRLWDDARGETVDADGYSKSGRNNTGEKKTNVFDTIVDRTKLLNVLGGVPYEKVTDAETQDGDIVKVGFYLADGDYSYDGKINGETVDAGVIICTGNVTFNQSFNGLVIAGGDVILNADGIAINSSSDAVDAAINWDALQDTSYVYDILREYFRSSVDASIKSGDERVKGNVMTQNWVKNDQQR